MKLYANIKIMLVLVSIGIAYATLFIMPTLTLAQAPPAAPAAPAAPGPGPNPGPNLPAAPPAIGAGITVGIGNNNNNAQTGTGNFTNPIQYNSIQEFLIAVLNAVALILFPIIVLMLVYSGFLFITAQGNPTKIAEARKIFFWTLIGGLIILGAEALSLAIAATVSEIQNGTI